MAISLLHAMLERLRRERHASNLNRIVNHPAVLPFVRGDREAPLDFSEEVRDPGNVLLMGQFGGVFFHKHQDGLYEAHTQVLPEGRGEWTSLMVRAALHWMFCKTDAVEVVTKVPRGNYAAAALTRQMGLRPEIVLPKTFQLKELVVDVTVYGQRVQDWMIAAPGLQERGVWFAESVLSEIHQMHGKPMTFDASAGALRYLGGACEMLLGGQPEKAIVLYNRWAALADRPLMALCSAKPTAINFDGSIVVVRDNGEIYLAMTEVDDVAVTH